MEQQRSVLQQRRFVSDRCTMQYSFSFYSFIFISLNLYVIEKDVWSYLRPSFATTVTHMTMVSVEIMTNFAMCNHWFNIFFVVVSIYQDNHGRKTSPGISILFRDCLHLQWMLEHCLAESKTILLYIVEYLSEIAALSISGRKSGHEEDISISSYNLS